MATTMKHLVLILVVALTAGQVLARGINEKDGQPEQSLARLSTNDKFRNFVENARYILREGNSTLGIPVLDPYSSEVFEFVLDEGLVKGEASVWNFGLIGLSEYVVDVAEVAVLKRKITLGLTFPRIDSKGSYKMDLRIKSIKAFGEGDYTISLSNLSFHTEVVLGLAGGMSVKSMETSISLGALEFSAEGLFHDESTSKILSEVISDMAPQLLQDYQRELTDSINEKVIGLANEYLKGKTWKDIKEIIGM